MRRRSWTNGDFSIRASADSRRCSTSSTRSPRTSGGRKRTSILPSVSSPTTRSAGIFGRRLDPAQVAVAVVRPIDAHLRGHLRRGSPVEPADGALRAEPLPEQRLLPALEEKIRLEPARADERDGAIEPGRIELVPDQRLPSRIEPDAAALPGRNDQRVGRKAAIDEYPRALEARFHRLQAKGLPIPRLPYPQRGEHHRGHGKGSLRSLPAKAVRGSGPPSQHWPVGSQRDPTLAKAGRHAPADGVDRGDDQDDDERQRWQQEAQVRPVIEHD